MSRKLATLIKDSRIPGKYKRVLEAYAAFANNDGTNIYASKEKIGKKAGTSPDTIYRNTPDLLACGILTVAAAHTCRIENCKKGATHFTGEWGHYTTAYNLHIGQLQNAETYLCAKQQKVNAAKCRKVGTADCGTTQALKETPASASPTLGKEDSSAVPLVSKKASKQVLLATTSLASTAAVPASQESQTLSGCKEVFVTEEQEQNQPQEQPLFPQTKEELFETRLSPELSEAADLLWKITPNVTDAMIREQLPLCVRILEFFPRADEYAVQAADLVLKFNRVHRSGKYATKDDKKLYIRDAAQYLKALESPSATLMNEYDSHDFKNCEMCRNAGVFDYKEFVREIRKEERRKAEQAEKNRIAEAELAARRAEEERIAKLCPDCRKNEPGKYVAYLGGGKGWVKVCDPCYDRKYEYQQEQLDRGIPMPIGMKPLAPRPEYLEAKRNAEAAELAAKLDANEIDVPVCLQCGQVTGHSRTCPTRQPKIQEATV